MPRRGAPFHRPSEVAVLNAHLHAPPPKLHGQPGGLEAVVAKALSKSPLDRYATCAEFLAAARAAAAERRVHPGRLAVSLTLLALAAALGAAAALGIRSLVAGDRASVTTVVRPRAPLPPRANLDKLLLKSNDGRTLNDAAFALIGAGAYRRAVPFARKAVHKTQAGSITRGYATFNLAYALLELGRCGESLPYFRKALKIEAPSQAPYIRPRIRQAKRCAQRGASAPTPSRS